MAVDDLGDMKARGSLNEGMCPNRQKICPCSGW